MTDFVQLLVGTERHAGFRSGQVSQSFAAQLAVTAWSFQYAARTDERFDPVVIEPGDDVTIRVRDEDLVQGWVDAATPRYDASSVGMAVSGFSKLIDLNDCSAFASSRRFRDQTLFQIVQALTREYGIQVIDQVQADEPFRVFAIQEGEKIAEAIGRAARMRGVVLEDEAGALVITRVGERTTSTVIERGRNVLAGSRTYSWRERYSEYRFRGQTQATDELYGLNAAQLGHTIEDREVTRLRRLVVQAHGQRRGDLGRRAVLERNARAGRSDRLQYEVPGWWTEEGDLWRPNTRVQVTDDWLRVNAELLVVEVVHAFAPNRLRTTLTLTRPETFSELEYPIRGRGRRWR